VRVDWKVRGRGLVGMGVFSENQDRFRIILEVRWVVRLFLYVLCTCFLFFVASMCFRSFRSIAFLSSCFLLYL